MLDASLDLHGSEPLVGKYIMLRAREEATRQGSARAIAETNKLLGTFYTREGEDSLARDAFQKAIPYMKNHPNKVNLLMVLYNLICLDYEDGLYEIVISRTDSCIRQAREISRQDYVAYFQELKGLAHVGQSDNLLALKEYIPSIQYFESVGDSGRLANTYQSIALCQWDLDKKKEAERYFRKAMVLCEYLDDKYQLAGVMNHLGLLFLEQDQLDSAEQYLMPSLHLNETYDFQLLSTSYAYLAILNGKKENIDIGRGYFDQAMTLYEEQYDHYSLAYLSAKWANVLLELDRNQEALNVLDKSLQRLGENPDEGWISDFYHPLAEVHRNLGNWKQSALHWEQYAERVDAQYKKDLIRQQNELFIVYETEKKEQELLLQQQENESLRQEARIQSLRLRNLWIGSGLVLSLVILIFILYRQRNVRKEWIKEKERKALEQELEFKKRELTTHTLHLVSKNKLLTDLRDSIQEIKQDSSDKQSFSPLIGSIDRDLRGDTNWAHFEQYFRQVYVDFDEKIKQAFTDLTGNEVRLVALMKMNLSTKEIAAILNITPESVNKARYRIRKKMISTTEQTLQQFILSL